jgi:hypothetical protein
MSYWSASKVVVWESAVTKNNSREMTHFGTDNSGATTSSLRALVLTNLANRLINAELRINIFDA